MDELKNYIKVILIIKGISSTDTAVDVLYEILDEINKDYSYIILIKSVKELIAKKIGKKLNNVNIIIYELVEKGILIRIGHGTYKINELFMDLLDNENKEKKLLISFKENKILIERYAK